MNKNWIIVITIVAILVIGGVYWYSNMGNMTTDETQTATSSVMNEETGGDETGTSSVSGGNEMEGDPMMENGEMDMTSETSAGGEGSTEANAILTVSEDPELGKYLVAENGMTLYLFTEDTSSESTCYGGCAVNWPPYTVSSAAVLSNVGSLVTGEMGVTTRTDGSLQVTYNGKPLYFWKNDTAPGDTTGQGVGDVWYVLAP